MKVWTSGGVREFELETPNLLWLVSRLSSISVPNFTTFPQVVLWAAIDAMAEKKRKKHKNASTIDAYAPLVLGP